MKTVKDLSLSGKRVLIRVDFNVPLKEGKITDDTRIRESLPTIEYCLKNGSSVIACAHMGRPKGTVNLKYSLEPVAARLSELLKKPVQFSKDCIGAEAKAKSASLKPGEILLLENLRFHPEEEKNVESFAKELASLADVFVQDAFGAVHRAHASTSAIAQFLPSAAGFLLEKEISTLTKVLKNPARPFVAILGGAKVSDKIGVIQNLSKVADTIIIGGAMAYTFLKSQGISVGKSLVEEDKLDLAKDLLANTKNLVLPVDHKVADKFEKGAKVQTTQGQAIDGDWIGIDVGPKSSQKIETILASAKTILWNGPLGVFEIPEFAEGTLSCARAIAKATEKGAFSVVGGGDSVAAVTQGGFAKTVSHISTGGGASLEFLEGITLPGVAAIEGAVHV